MDYGSGWAKPPPPPGVEAHYCALPQPAQHPNPSAAQPQLPPHPHYSAAAASYYTNPNPNPNPNPISVPAARPEAYEQYAPPSYAPHGAYGDAGTAPYSYPAAPAPPPAGAGAGVGLSYYYGAGGADAHLSAPIQYGYDPYRYATAVPRPSNGNQPTPAAFTAPPQWTIQPAHHLSRGGAMWKRVKKTPKIVTPVHCEVCKIACDTPDVLKVHKQGQKHKKNLQKLQDSITRKPNKAASNSAETKQVPIASINTPVKRPDPVPSKGKFWNERSKKKSMLATPEELEVKKRRVLEAGAPSEAVRICSVCNVVVNDQKVFEYHIAGQKHAAMAKKHQEQQARTAS